MVMKRNEPQPAVLNREQPGGAYKANVADLYSLPIRPNSYIFEDMMKTPRPQMLVSYDTSSAGTIDNVFKLYCSGRLRRVIVVVGTDSSFFIEMDLGDFHVLVNASPLLGGILQHNVVEF